jgi:hypothetical protein
MVWLFHPSDFSVGASLPDGPNLVNAEQRVKKVKSDRGCGILHNCRQGHSMLCPWRQKTYLSLTVAPLRNHQLLAGENACWVCDAVGSGQGVHINTIAQRDTEQVFATLDNVNRATGGCIGCGRS